MLPLKSLGAIHNLGSWSFEEVKASPVQRDTTDDLTTESYSVPDPGPGVSSCQLTWRDGLPQVEVRSRSGRSFTLP